MKIFQIELANFSGYSKVAVGRSCNWAEAWLQAVNNGMWSRCWYAIIAGVISMNYSCSQPLPVYTSARTERNLTTGFPVVSWPSRQKGAPQLERIWISKFWCYWRALDLSFRWDGRYACMCINCVHVEKSMFHCSPRGGALWSCDFLFLLQNSILHFRKRFCQNILSDLVCELFAKETSKVANFKSIHTHQGWLY